MLPGGGHGGARRRINQPPPPPLPPSLPPPHHHHHHHQSLNTINNMLLSPPPHTTTTTFSDHHQYQPPQMISSPAASVTSGGEHEFPKRDERFPQWEIQETKEFIRVRAELHVEFAGSKRSPGLWESVSARMREKGYYRNSDQCKTKWKNLIAKYKENKEKEGTHVDMSNQFPFFEELNGFFSIQEKQMFLNSEPGSSKLGKRERATGSAQSLEEIHDIDKNIESDEDWIAKGPSTVKKKKVKKEKASDQPNIPDNTNTPNALNGLVETLQGFFQQQQKIEMLWMESMERHAQERALSEQEWRKSVEKLERERLMMENAWKEREEERRSREENRAERRDALMTALLNKLVHD